MYSKLITACTLTGALLLDVCSYLQCGASDFSDTYTSRDPK